MSTDNFFTIGKYSTLCMLAISEHGHYMNFLNTNKEDFEEIQAQLDAHLKWVKETQERASNLFPMFDRVSDTLKMNITYPKHTAKALTIGGGEDNALDTILKLDRLIADNSYLYCIPTSTFVVYLNVLYNLFTHSGVHAKCSEELPTNYHRLLKVGCSLPVQGPRADSILPYTEVVLRVIDMFKNSSALHERSANYTIFLEQPTYLMASLLNLIQQKLENVGPSLYVTKVKGEYSITEFTEAANLCLNIKKLYHACLSCPSADNCVPSLTKSNLSPVRFTEWTIKSVLEKTGMEFIPPSVASFQPANIEHTVLPWHKRHSGSIQIKWQPEYEYGAANSLSANFIPSETRNALNDHKSKQNRIKQFKEFRTSTCSKCALRSACHSYATTQNELSYHSLEDIVDVCPKPISYKDLEVSRRSILEFILTAAHSGTAYSYTIPATTLDKMATEIGSVLTSATLTKEAKKSIRFLEYMEGKKKCSVFAGTCVLPTALIQLLNKYAKYFTIKNGSTKGDLFHSQYDTLYHNLGMVPSKTDSWVVVKANTLDMAYSEHLLQSSRNTLDKDEWSRPLFSTIGCKDFLYNVNYEGLKSKLRSYRVIKNKPNLDVLLLNLAFILTPVEREINYGWMYGSNSMPISFANKNSLIALPGMLIKLSEFIREEDIENPSYLSKVSRMIEYATQGYWYYYNTKLKHSEELDALSNRSYKKALEAQDKVLSKSLIYVCINIYINNSKFNSPKKKLELIRLLRSKL